MRIISKFHDYYDGVARHGIDESLLYVRKEEECEGDPEELGVPEIIADLVHLRGQSQARVNGRVYYTIEPDLFVLVAGAEARLGQKWRLMGPVSYEDRFTFGYDGAMLLAQDLKEKHDRIGIQAWLHSGCRGVWNGVWERPIKDILYDGERQVHRAAAELRRKQDAPVLLIDWRTSKGGGVRVVRNPVLKDHGATNCWTDWMAYSLIMQHLANQAHPDPGDVQVDDRHLAAKKGFGHKYAFRKEPEKKR